MDTITIARRCLFVVLGVIASALLAVGLLVVLDRASDALGLHRAGDVAVMVIVATYAVVGGLAAHILLPPAQRR